MLEKFPSHLVYTTNSLPSKYDCPDPIAGIYAIRNTVSGRIYIGSSESVIRRFRAHISELNRGIHHSPWLQRSWKKHGEEKFQFILLEVHDRDGLIVREQELIDVLKPDYNTAVCAENGMKGRRHSPESIAKISERRKGKGTAPRTISPAGLESRRRAGEARRGKPAPWRLGKPHTDETKAIMSVKAKARLAKLATHPNARPVELNGVVYSTGKQAGESIGVGSSRIVQMIKLGYARYMDESANDNQPIAPYVPKVNGKNHPKARAVVIDGIHFDTQRDAAAHFGMTNPGITYWLKTGKAQYAQAA